jgi:putative phosphoribosyl transferase
MIPLGRFGLFENRRVAGKALAEAVATKDLSDPIVLALPRGGVPVAAEVAKALKAPLDLVMVRKIGVPWQPELAAAAVIDGKDPQIVVNEEVCTLAEVDRSYIDEAAKKELEEIERRRSLYLKDHPPAPIAGRSVIVVDDGIATGTTMRAVIKALRARGPRSILLAVPVAPADAVGALRAEVDDIICLATPEPFYGIGLHYADFHQVPDEEVIKSLDEAREVTEAEKAKQAKKPEGSGGKENGSIEENGKT